MARLKHRLEYAVLRTIARKAQRLGPIEAGAYGRTLGRRLHRLWSSRRRIAADNLRRAYGESVGNIGVDDAVVRVFENFGETATEVLRLPAMDRDELVGRVDGDISCQLDAALSDGRGAIVLSGHLGNWELFGAWTTAKGYAIDVLVKPFHNPLVNAHYNDCRRSLGVGVIATQNDTRGIVRALRQNRIVAILGDQYAGAEGIDVEFFGQRVSTPRGPAALALKMGVPIVCGALVRRPGGRYELTAEETPLDIARTDDFERDQRRIMQQYTTILERYIRNDPTQWLWTHRRWGRGAGSSREPAPDAPHPATVSDA